MTVTVTSTMPPRRSTVRIQGWPSHRTDTVAPVVAFAVWSDGQITPIVEITQQDASAGLCERLATFPAVGVFGRTSGASWALIDPDEIELTTAGLTSEQHAAMAAAAARTARQADQ